MLSRVNDVKFTVAICTWNRCDILKDTISAVISELKFFPNGKLLIVDNASTDETSQVLTEIKDKDSRISSVIESKRGAYHAISRAIQMVSDDFMIFVDDDAMPSPGCFSALLTILSENQRVGYVGAAIDPAWSGPRPRWMGERALREVPVIDWPLGLTVCEYPRYPPSVTVGLRVVPCLRLFGTTERQLIELGWGGGAATGLSTVGGDDHDLAELYVRNGYQAVASGDARVRHRIVPEKLSPEWLVKKFASEGRLRIRFARVAGYPVLSRHAIPLLLALPVLAGLLPIGAGLPEMQRTLLRAYFAKALGAWRELLFGVRGVQFQYEA